jgi:pilus assembly protein CpaF
MNKNVGLYLSEKEPASDYSKIFSEVQKFMSGNYKELLSSDDESNQAQMYSYIRQYLTQHKLHVEGLTTEDLINRLYNDMAESGFLTKYLNFIVGNVEGIEINSWDDVKVKFSDGRVISDEHFYSPENAKNVLIRLLSKSNITMDNSKPLVRGHIGKNIRITVNGGGGTLDEDVGVAASIRFVNPNHLRKEDLIRSGTATDEMLYFLCMLYRYGVSMMLAGETDAGKTTVMSILMKMAVQYWKKLITIENGTREFDLTERYENDRIMNSVVHMITKESDKAELLVTQQMLLELAMTMNPDYICMAEVKGSEAFETIEAALTGHPVIGTTHTFSAEEIPDRLVQLASLQGSGLSDKTLYSMAVKAFPILFYAQKMEDGVRRITKICECYLQNERPAFTTLYQYIVERNEISDGKTIIHGHFEKCNPISEYLQSRLRIKGMPEEVLYQLLGGDTK